MFKHNQSKIKKESGWAVGLQTWLVTAFIRGKMGIELKYGSPLL